VSRSESAPLNDPKPVLQTRSAARNPGSETSEPAIRPGGKHGAEIERGLYECDAVTIGNGLVSQSMLAADPWQP
jgi:hypothetical protein